MIVIQRMEDKNKTFNISDIFNFQILFNNF